jgi:vacuolar-type H+-ATPase subunit I/STV1
LINTFKGFQ